MAALTSMLVGSLLALLFYGMVRAKSRRRVLALTLAAVLVVALIGPPSAHSQGTLVAAIESVLQVINGLIKTALSSMNSVRTATSNFYQQVAWPVALINQAKAMVTQMISQYRSLMQGIFNINLESATLPSPMALESAARNRQINDFSTLAIAFRDTYGVLPTATAAGASERTMMDMDDALAQDSLKTLKESDAADDLALQVANNIENAAGQAAPGSAPFLTASAVAASIEGQALMQKMLAAEMREEAACLAHENALRKRGAALTGDVNAEILRLLERK